MKPSNDKAFTLVEILVASAIAGIVALLAYQQLSSALRFSARNQDHFELEKSKVILVREIKRLFERSASITPTPPAGPVVGGFTLNGRGSLVFKADLRPCLSEGAVNSNAFFNPMTAVDTNPIPLGSASSYTLVSLVCCPGPAVPTTQVNNPYGGRFNVATACRRGPGLTINYRRGGQNDSRCLGDYGDSNASYAALRYQANVGYDQSRVRHPFAPLFIRTASGGSAVAPNTGSYTPTQAQNLSYLSFFTNDSVDTGQANQRVSAHNDQQAVTEYFGRIGNLQNDRYISCGRGVQD